ncbi:MAG: hypothetical protein AUJ70_02070 [Candidatus Omnitrophica bacterium CG1_02_40_15]|nr:MAG: hypothetical protein AUJ70_02070 [Candidatus Omnitrophica bacterium CG1_02_40_15]
MRIKIETKIGGVLLIFFIELIIFTYSVYVIDKRHNQDHLKLHKSAEKMQLLKNLQIGLAQVVMPANDFLIPGGSPDEPENFKILSGNVEGLIKKINDIKFGNVEEGRLMKHIEKEYIELKNTALQIFSISDAIGNIEAGKLMEKMDAVADDVIRDAENFSRFIHSENLQIEAKSDMTKTLFSLVMLIGIMMNIIFILGLWFFFKRTISSPIIHLRDTALEIAHGDMKKRVDIKLKDEIGELGTVFNYMVDALRASEEDIRQDSQIQGILNKLLKISLENIPLEEVLKKAISYLTPWSKVMPKGGIFLVEDKPGVLVLKAQQGLSAEIQTMCASVPFGRCLCGKAVLSGEIIFSGHIDERHENQYKGIMPHGHYCVPIISMDKEILGMINLYLDEGHQANDKEKEFLHAVANILAGIIERKKIEEHQKLTLKDLEDSRRAIKNTAEDLMESNEILEYQKKSLEDVNKELDDFTYIVSHDLKEPLRSIDAYSKFIIDDYKDKLSEEGRHYLERVRANTERMKKLIEDLLEISRLKKRGSTIEEVETAELITEVKMRLEYAIKQKGVEIIIKGKLPKIFCDRIRLTEVFLNLISNAIKFNDKQKPVIEIGYDDQGDLHKFYIKDNGIGIKEEYFEKIFEIFQRLGKREDVEGTGAGLTIVKKIIQIHKGDIWVESKPGEGSVFYFTIPKDRSVILGKKLIGEILLERKLVTEDDIKKALEEQQRMGRINKGGQDGRGT